MYLLTKQRLWALIFILAVSACTALLLTELFFPSGTDPEPVMWQSAHDSFSEVMHKFSKSLSASISNTYYRVFLYARCSVLYSLPVSFMLYVFVDRQKILLTLLSPVIIFVLMMLIRFLIYSLPGMSAVDEENFRIMSVAYILSWVTWCSWRYRDILQDVER